jgi:hypothetical protein
MYDGISGKFYGGGHGRVCGQYRPNLKPYENAGHGFGLGVGTDATGWIEFAIRFWESHFHRHLKIRIFVRDQGEAAYSG